jgi:predicted DsbA family dithiol-disulfide isomerase
MRVEIWSDVICPWCYIGKRRFEAALAQWDGADDVEVVFRPYQLDPRAAPGVTTPVREAYARKFGGYERADEIIRHLTDVAAADGLEFHMDRAQRANTLLAHRLLWLAEETCGPAVQVQLKERLLQAYFVDGDNVGDPETLARLALDAGLPADRVHAVLDGDLGRDEVAAELQQAYDLGITAVPTFVFDGRWTVPGAQDPEVFVNVLGRVRALQQEAAVAARGGVCVDDTCEI